MHYVHSQIRQRRSDNRRRPSRTACVGTSVNVLFGSLVQYIRRVRSNGGLSQTKRRLLRRFIALIFFVFFLLAPSYQTKNGGSGRVGGRRHQRKLRELRMKVSSHHKYPTKSSTDSVPGVCHIFHSLYLSIASRCHHHIQLLQFGGFASIRPRITGHFKRSLWLLVVSWLWTLGSWNAMGAGGIF